jgi:phosphopantothenoylcysteine decarboxylase/phosphopantothenate--cysteine ligase
VVEHAAAKVQRKGCDWIVANDVSGDVMGGDSNSVHLVRKDGVESWERLPKSEVARRLADRIAAALEGSDADEMDPADAAGEIR